MLTTALSQAPSSDDPRQAARRLLSALNRPGPLIVAVSGGGDSMALLAALHAACGGEPALRRPLLAVTVDHGLRAGSAQEARQVAAFCAERAIAHRVAVWRGDKPASGVQAAARMARYRLLAAIAAETGAVAVVTAHTFDDQAETVAMRAARVGDEGPARGLAGMAPATLFERDTWILRPFLGLSRSGLRAWLATRRLGWIEDPSNTDRRFERARMRAAGTPNGLAGRIAAFQEQRSRRAEALAELIGRSARLHGGIIVSLAAAKNHLSDPHAGDAVATLMTIVGGRAHAPARRTGERIEHFLAAMQPGRMTAAGAVADLRRERLFVYRERRGVPDFRVPSGARVVYDGRYMIDNSRGTAPVAIGPRPHAATPDETHLQAMADVPPGVIGRALAGEPAGIPLGASANQDHHRRGNPLVTRHFAPFDVFLPLFDLTLANGCSALFDRPPYLPPPVSS